jgi:hypothetical protein
MTLDYELGIEWFIYDIINLLYHYYIMERWSQVHEVCGVTYKRAKTYGRHI